MRTIGLVAALCWPLAVQSAVARRHADFAYPLARVWTSAVRLLRVDLESPISEKDRQDGYFLFDYPHAGRIHSGSVEVVPLRTGGGGVVRVYVQVSGLPSYVERMMLTRLEKKLAAEYGSPVKGVRTVDTDASASTAPSTDVQKEEAGPSAQQAPVGGTESPRP